MQLHYTDQGTGTALVLIHGFCESSFIWDDFVTTLAKKYRVITLDLPGFGKSSQPYEQPSLLNYADDVSETLMHLGIDKPVMIGHSLGGYVALAYGKKYGENLLGLGLFHSTAFADPESKKLTRTKSIDFIKTHGAETFIRNMFGNLFSSAKKTVLKPEIEAFIMHCCETQASSIMKTQLAMRDREESINVITNLEVPILFIVGKDDQSVTLDKSMEQAAIPKNAVVHVLANVAHMGMIEEPVKTLKAVSNFMEYCLSE